MKCIPDRFLTKFIFGMSSYFCLWQIAEGEEQFDVGMLACVVQVRRMEPSQPGGVVKGILASAYSSAFLVRDPEFKGTSDQQLKSRVFLVTAAHNLVDCEDVQISITSTKTDSSGSFSMFFDPNAAKKRGMLNVQRLKEFVYFDEAEDIAVVEATAEWAEDLNSQKAKIVGSLLSSESPEEDRQRLPRGAIASAAGTIQESGQDAIHPAYSCTLSRYISGYNLVSDAVDNDFKSVSSVLSDPSSMFRRDVYSRISKLQYLMVESMSITAGFSGSPVMISNDHFRLSGDIVGMVLGGQPKPGIGRAAWATPADSIKRAIDTVKSANEGKLNWQKEQHDSSDRDFVVLKAKEAGRWVFNRDVRAVKSVLADRFRTPYRTRFSVESRIEFTPVEPDAPLCGDDLKRRIQDLPGRSFVFRNLTFNKTCLNKVNLLTPYFVECTFNQTEFQGAVLSGPTFYNCKFVGNDQQAVSLHEIIEQPCAFCSPAAIVAPYIVENLNFLESPAPTAPTQ